MKNPQKMYTKYNRKFRIFNHPTKDMLKIFVDSEADIRLARRLKRDIGERGRSIDSVLALLVSKSYFAHHPTYR